MKRVEHLLRDVLNRDTDRKDVNLTKFKELLTSLGNSSTTYKFNDLSLFIKIVDIGMRFINLREIEPSPFWFLLMKSKFDPKLMIDENFEDCLSFLIDSGLNIEGNQTNWKILVLLNNILDILPQAQDICLEVLATYFTKNYGTIDSYLNSTENVQQVFYLLKLLLKVFGKSQDSIFQNVIKQIKKKHNIKNQLTQIVIFIMDQFIKELSQNTFKISSIAYNFYEDKQHCIDPIQLGDETFCLVQFINENIYIWGKDNFCLELNRYDVNIIKTLKNEIKISMKIKEFSSVNIINAPMNFQLIVSQIKWFQLKLADPTMCESFFYNITNATKISQSNVFIALDYLDVSNDSEEEVGNKKVEIKNDTSVCDISTDMTNSLPEMNKESEPENEIPLSLQRKETCTETKKLPTQLATPDHSDSKFHDSNEWELNETNNNVNDLSFEIQEEEDDKFLPPKLNNIEESPVVLAQKRKMARERTKTLESLQKEFELENFDSNNNNENNSSLVITKFEEKIPIPKFPKANIGNKNINKRKIMTPKVKSIGQKEISLLNTIFGSTNKQAVTPRFKKSTKNNKVSKQGHLSNLKPIITIPSQDIIPNLPKNTETEAIVGVVAEDKGPALRTRAQNTRKLRIMKKIPTKKNYLDKELKKNLEVISENKEPTNHDVTSVKTNSKPIESENIGPPQITPFEKIYLPHTPANLSLNDSTTLLNTSTSKSIQLNSKDVLLGNMSFTEQLQAQINNSVQGFSNQLVRKLEIINEELNKKIMHELSLKYQKLVTELQKSFQNDTTQMLNFISEIQTMLNLPEDDLIRIIKKRTFNDTAE